MISKGGESNTLKLLQNVAFRSTLSEMLGVDATDDKFLEVVRQKFGDDKSWLDIGDGSSRSNGGRSSNSYACAGNNGTVGGKLVDKGYLEEYAEDKGAMRRTCDRDTAKKNGWFEVGGGGRSDGRRSSDAYAGAGFDCDVGKLVEKENGRLIGKEYLDRNVADKGGIRRTGNPDSTKKYVEEKSKICCAGDSYTTKKYVGDKGEIRQSGNPDPKKSTRKYISTDVDKTTDGAPRAPTAISDVTKKEDVSKRIGFISFDEYLKKTSDRSADPSSGETNKAETPLCRQIVFRCSSIDASEKTAAPTEASREGRIDDDADAKVPARRSSFHIPSFNEYLESTKSVANNFNSLKSRIEIARPTPINNQICSNFTFKPHNANTRSEPACSQINNLDRDPIENKCQTKIAEETAAVQKSVPRNRAKENEPKSDSSRSKILLKTRQTPALLASKPTTTTTTTTAVRNDERVSTVKHKRPDQIDSDERREINGVRQVSLYPNFGKHEAMTSWARTYPRKSSTSGVVGGQGANSLRGSLKRGHCASQDSLNTIVKDSMPVDTALNASLNKPIQTELNNTSELNEAIKELLNTEVSYGKDLEIIKNEFYLAFEKKFLLTNEQLETIFLNLDDLINLNKFFVEKFLCAFNYPRTLGQMLQECAMRLKPFEVFCIYHACSSNLLEKLVQERELLRIFLFQLQKENQFLRRMDLKSFLIKPVQRITKYPLIFDRFLKCLPPSATSYSDILDAKNKLESTLTTINSQTVSSIKLKRPSLMEITDNSSDVNSSLLTQISFDVLKWKRSETTFNRMGCINLLPVLHCRWPKEIMLNKMYPVYCVIASRNYTEKEDCINGVSQCSDSMTAVMIIIREKGKVNTVEDIVYLDKTVISMAECCEPAIMIDNIVGNCYVVTADKISEWLKELQDMTGRLGRWRCRRNALVNAIIPELNFDQDPPPDLSAAQPTSSSETAFAASLSDHMLY